MEGVGIHITLLKPSKKLSKFYKPTVRSWEFSEVKHLKWPSHADIKTNILCIYQVEFQYWPKQVFHTPTQLHMHMYSTEACVKVCAYNKIVLVVFSCYIIKWPVLCFTHT